MGSDGTLNAVDESELTTQEVALKVFVFLSS